MDGLPLTDLGPDAILALVVIMILTGRLVPRKSLDDQKEETKHWRTAHALSEAAREQAASQVDELMEHTRTTNHALRSISKAAESKEQE